MCEKKKLTKREATSTLNCIKKRNVNRALNRRFRREVRSYHCPECNHWHLTSMKYYEGDKKEMEVNLIENERWKNILKNNNYGYDNN